MNKARHLVVLIFFALSTWVVVENTKVLEQYQPRDLAMQEATLRGL